MTILYLTATGNCLYVAKRIGGKLYSIPQVIKEGHFLFEDDVIGIIFPNFGLCVPPYIEEFISKVQLKSSYNFAIITYGFYNGAAVSYFNNIAQKASLKFAYVNKLKMIENYIPAFDMNKQLQKEGKKKIEEKLLQIIDDIKIRKQFIYKDSMLDKLMTKRNIKNYSYKTGIGMTKDFCIEDKCTSCGTCAKVCPANNILVENSKPVFGTKCISCLACTHNCPENAIRMTSEKNTKRFRNQNIKLEEIINANK